MITCDRISINASLLPLVSTWRQVIHNGQTLEAIMSALHPSPNNRRQLEGRHFPDLPPVTYEQINSSTDAISFPIPLSSYLHLHLTPILLDGFKLAMSKGPSNQCPCSSRLRDANRVCGQPEPYWLCDGTLMKLIRLAGLHWRILECTLYSEYVFFGAPLHWTSLSWSNF